MIINYCKTSKINPYYQHKDCRIKKTKQKQKNKKTKQKQNKTKQTNKTKQKKTKNTNETTKSKANNKKHSCIQVMIATFITHDCHSCCIQPNKLTIKLVDTNTTKILEPEHIYCHYAFCACHTHFIVQIPLSTKLT